MTKKLTALVSRGEKYLTHPDAITSTKEIIKDIIDAWNVMSFDFYLGPTRIHTCGISSRVSTSLIGSLEVSLRGDVDNQEQREIIYQIYMFIGIVSDGCCRIDRGQPTGL